MVLNKYFFEALKKRLENILKTLSGNRKAFVVWGGSTATDVKNTVYLVPRNEIEPGVPASLPELLIFYKACVAHEGAHIKFTSLPAWQEATKRGAVFQHLTNIIEDGRCEAAISNELPGAGKWIRFSNTYIYQHREPKRYGEGLMAFLMGLNLYSILYRIPPFLSEETKNLIKLAAPHVDIGRASTSTYEVLSCVEEILKIPEIQELVKKHTPPPALEGSKGTEKPTKSSPSDKASDRAEKAKTIIVKRAKKSEEKSEESEEKTEEETEEKSSEKSEESDKSDDKKSGDKSEAPGESEDPDKSEDPEETSESVEAYEEDPEEDPDDESDGSSDKKGSEESDKSDDKKSEDPDEAPDDYIEAYDEGDDPDEPEEDDEPDGSSSSGKSDDPGDSDKSDNSGKSGDSDDSGGSEDAEDPEDISGGSEGSDNSGKTKGDSGTDDEGASGSKEEDSEDDFFLEPDEVEDFRDVLEQTDKEAASISKDAESLEEDEKVPDLTPHDSRIHAGVTLQEYVLPKLPGYDDMKKRLQPVINKLVNEIRISLEARKAYHLRAQKKGRLDANSLWKTAVPDPSVFSKRVIPGDVPDLAVFILCDLSGSMSCYDGTISRMMAATDAVSVLSEACRALKIVHKAVGFEAQRSNTDVRHHIAVDWNDTDSSGIAYFSAKDHNRDGYSIRVATNDLELRPEPRKILFVLSDGEPFAVDYRGPRANKDVQEAVLDARKKRIEVISLFFGDQEDVPSFKFMYDTPVFVNDLNMLPGTLGQIFKKIMLK